jgi:hypothetical protein
MKIYNLVTAFSAICFRQYGEAADNFSHTGTVRKGNLRSLNGHNQSRDDISLANKNEDIPGCAHMDVSAVLLPVDFEVFCFFVCNYVLLALLFALFRSCRSSLTKFSFRL